MNLLCFLAFLSAISVARSELELESYAKPSSTDTNSGTVTGTKWYINESDGICTKFQFYTYALNLNVFNTREDCIKHIEFTPEEKLASCGTTNPATEKKTQKKACKGLKSLRYTFVAATGSNPAECKRFTYYGCGGSANNFRTVKECMEICLPGSNEDGNSADCLFSPTLPQGTEEMATAVIADQDNQQCVRAAISSAQVRGKFSSLSHCRKTCFPDAGEENLRCRYSPKQGLCLGATVKKYYFDRETFNCLPYYTKDCVFEDMMNSFENYEDCIGTCPSADYRKDAPQGWPDATEMCYQAKNSGVGIMDIPSFYYNHETKECSAFIYTGLRGNDNRFETRELCMAVCSGQPVQKVYHSDDHTSGVHVDINDGIHMGDKANGGGDSSIFGDEEFHVLPNIMPDSHQ